MKADFEDRLDGEDATNHDFALTKQAMGWDDDPENRGTWFTALNLMRTLHKYYSKPIGRTHYPEALQHPRAIKYQITKQQEGQVCYSVESLQQVIFGVLP